MFITSKLCFRKLNLYFNQELSRPVRTDIIHFHQWPIAVPGSRSERCYTRVLDLRKDAAELLDGMNTNTRRDLSRAEGDGFAYEYWEDGSTQAIDLFCGLHNRFATLKGSAPADPSYFRQLAAAGLLDMSLLRMPDGQPVAWCSYLVANARARDIRLGSNRLATKNSAERRILGRAGRLLLWKDMQRFQQRGFSIYDQGGWYIAQENEELLGINQYKAGFGGTIVQEFDCVLPISMLGSCVVPVMGARHKIMEDLKARFAYRKAAWSQQAIRNTK